MMSTVTADESTSPIVHAVREFAEGAVTAPVQLVRLRIADVVRDPALQARVGLDEEVVKEYETRYRTGAWMPAPIVYRVGDQDFVAEGFHRVEGAERAGLTEIEFEVRCGTRRDALLFAVGANATHGLRRSNADKRRAVQIVLTDDEWRSWTDQRIANTCGVTDRFVSGVRRELGLDTTEPRIDSKGRKRRLPRSAPNAEREETDKPAPTPNGSGSVGPTPNASGSVAPSRTPIDSEPADYLHPKAVPGFSWLLRGGRIVGVRAGGHLPEIVLDDAPDPGRQAGTKVADEASINCVLDVSLLRKLPTVTLTECACKEARALPSVLSHQTEFVFGRQTPLLSEPMQVIATALKSIARVVAYARVESTSVNRARAGRVVVLVYGAPLQGGRHDVRVVALGRYDNEGRRPLTHAWVLLGSDRTALLAHETFAKTDLLYALIVEPTALGAPAWLAGGAAEEEQPTEEEVGTDQPSVSHGLDPRVLGLVDESGEDQ